jgi:hypothetical protein
MSPHDHNMREIEDIAAHAWTRPHELVLFARLDSDDVEEEMKISFDRDVDGTWSVILGSNFMAVRNESQAQVIERFVELFVGQRQSIIFDRDGTERSDR